MQSLADCFPVMLAEMPAVLLDGHAAERLQTIARRLPARFVMHQVNLECPLGQRTASADLHVIARRAQDGSNLLRESATWGGTAADQHVSPESMATDAEAALSGAAAIAPRGTWQTVVNLARVWDCPPWDCRLDDLALHFALHDEGCVEPDVYIGPLIESHDDRLWEAWGGQVLPCLLGHPPDRILLDLLNLSRYALPAQACVFQVGVLRSRPLHGVRVAISHIHLDGVTAFLQRMNVDHDDRVFQQELRWLRRFADQFTLYLDLPVRNAANISLVCSLDAKRSAQPLPERWALFLHGLEGRGLCLPEKHQALLDCAASLVGNEHSECWPREALQMQHLMCRQSVLQRRLNQITLDFDRGRVTQARAGLTYGHEWGEVWYSQHGGSC